MKKVTLHIFLLSALLVLPLSLPAQWYESNGKAPIIEGDINKSRDNAVSNALLSISYSAGTSIETIQVVKSGVLKTNELTIRSHGEIHDMHFISERVADGMIHVTIEADLYPFSQCPQEVYSKPIFVGPFHLKTRRHAQLGRIYQTDEAVSERLFYQMKRESKKLDPRHVMTQQIAFTQDNFYSQELKTLEIARQISSKYDVQYLLFGTIEDMSDYYETSGGLLSTTKHKRNFQMNVFLIDGINKMTIFQKNYKGTSDWSFDMTHNFDVKSAEFWMTKYGKMIDAKIKQAVSDSQQALYCQPTMATIIAQYEDQVIMNIGHRNNVKKGDKFQLVRSRYVSHQNSLLQGPLFIPDDILLTVVSLQSDRAILKTSNPADMNNIQIRDMLTPVDAATLKRLSTQNTNSLIN